MAFERGILNHNFFSIMCVKTIIYCIVNCKAYKSHESLTIELYIGHILQPVLELEKKEMGSNHSLLDKR